MRFGSPFGIVHIGQCLWCPGDYSIFPFARVRSTRISTLGGEVVDAFYLAGELSADDRARVQDAVLQAATPA